MERWNFTSPIARTGSGPAPVARGDLLRDPRSLPPGRPSALSRGDVGVSASWNRSSWVLREQRAAQIPQSAHRVDEPKALGYAVDAGSRVVDPLLSLRPSPRGSQTRGGYCGRRRFLVLHAVVSSFYTKTRMDTTTADSQLVSQKPTVSSASSWKGLDRESHHSVTPLTMAHEEQVGVPMFSVGPHRQGTKGSARAPPYPRPQASTRTEYSKTS
ncbi:hypothetical protein PG994_013186 [Apiospora phragmitis]|uniref:Uncharacterized protein n=1 Tax=Apiospora phragmitis TaxID=2905665 RepID=A0ABR1T7X8_9PEZI